MSGLDGSIWVFFCNVLLSSLFMAGWEQGHDEMTASPPSFLQCLVKTNRNVVCLIRRVSCGLGEISWGLLNLNLVLCTLSLEELLLSGWMA